jgi:acetyl-CoA C-acetyltransferase
MEPVHGSSTTTAGNTPTACDGASALAIMTESRAIELGLEPLAVIVETAFETDTAYGLAWIAGLAAKKVLKKAGLTVDDLDLIEVNESFSPMPLVGTKVMADGDIDLWYKLLEKTNVNGGAIGAGYPIAGSAARCIMTLMYELRRRGGGRGLICTCGALAQGEAMIIEV